MFRMIQDKHEHTVMVGVKAAAELEKENQDSEWIFTIRGQRSRPH